MKKKRTISRTRRVVLDRVLGDALKKEGMSAAEWAADLAWRRRAQKTILKVAREKTKFTTDDVWKAGLDRPREPRALGPEMNSAETAGVIVSTDIFKLTVQASRHRAPVRVWQSLVFGKKTHPDQCEDCGRVAFALFGGLCAKCDAKWEKDPKAQRRIDKRMKARDAADATKKKTAAKKPAKKKKKTVTKKPARSKRVVHTTKKRKRTKK